MSRSACEDYKIAARLAHDNYDRSRKLSKIGSVSDEIMDQVRSRKDDADVRLDVVLRHVADRR